MYAYEARDAGELSVEEGKDCTIVEPDDGGWTKIRVDFGAEGLVPTAYLEELPPGSSAATPPAVERPMSTYSNSSASLASATTGTKKKGPAVAPKRGARKVKYVESFVSIPGQQ